MTIPKRVYFYISSIILIICLLFAMTYMPGKSYTGAFPNPTDNQIQLSKDFKNQLEQFATEPRNSMHWGGLKKAQDFLVLQLKKNGFQKIEEQNFGTFKNLEVIIEPSKEATQTLVIGAHYDSAFDAIGADDNGSSVVILLELARRFQNFKSEHTRLRIVFFTNEEPPHFKTSLMGSAEYAKMLYEKKENVIAMYAFDALGYFKEEKGTQHYPIMFAPFYPSTGNFVAFVGNWSSRKLVIDSLTAFRKDAQFPSEGISAWQKIQGIDFSDHLNFYNYGWKGLMVTDTAFNRNPTYHTTEDTIDKLDLIKMAQLTDELEKMFRTLYEDN